MGDPSEERWRKLLTEGHRPLRRAHLCLSQSLRWQAGWTDGVEAVSQESQSVHALLRHPSAWGAEFDIAVLFADVRGSTALGERLEPSAYAALLNRFYRAATDVLIRRDAIIDKLIGDEVMALFIPGICGPHYRRRAARAAVALLHAVGYGQSTQPWMPIGVAVNSGVTYVGNVGSEGVVDFTALGNTVNTAARLASSAGGGHVLLSEPVYAAIADQLPNLERRNLTLRGKETGVAVRVLSCD